MLTMYVSPASVEADVLGCIYMDKKLILSVYTTHHLKQARAIGGAFCCKASNVSARISGTDANDVGIIPIQLSVSNEMKTYYARHNIDYDCVTIGESISKLVGDEYIITTKEKYLDDMHNWMLSKTTLPIAKDWTSYIADELTRQGLMESLYGADSNGTTTYIPFCDGVVTDETVVESSYTKWTMKKNGAIYTKGFEVPLWTSSGVAYVPFKELLCFHCVIDDAVIEPIIEKGITTGAIWHPKKAIQPLNIVDYDDYVTRYSSYLEESLDKEVIPLNPNNYDLNTALKKSRLYTKQRGCVNAIARAKEAGRRFALCVAEMGTGKTKMSLSTMDEYFNTKWLNEHPGKTLEDCFRSREVSYRAIITGPGHIVEKWKEESVELPDVKTEIIRDIGDFIKLKNRGIERNGKELYIISKDALKLSYSYSPSPSKVAKMVPKRLICDGCHNERNKIVSKPSVGHCRCPECGGTNWKLDTFPGISHLKVPGLVCPHCSNLLLKGTVSILSGKCDVEEAKKAVMVPTDFASKKSDNLTCYHCGEPLWGADVKNIGDAKKPKRMWRKISHFANLQKKSKKTSWVYLAKGIRKDESGMEQTYYPYLEELLQEARVPDSEYTWLSEDAGVRRLAPSEYIKKYLNGYFDFCILDECHKFEGSGTAQSTAAAALVKVSDFTIGLTGTIANGKADSFFWLLWMLMPREMQLKGYAYDHASLLRFVKKYGSLKTVYSKDAGNYAYNQTSRGRQIGSPKIAPGISPLLFVDFLLENCVFLDMGDMSSKLPKLTEQVIPVKLPDNILMSYFKDIRSMKDAIMRGEGMTIASTMLQYSLSYPDMPFNVPRIVSPTTKDVTITVPEDYSDIYANELLPKEVEMVNIIRGELEEGRRCFVFTSFTGNNSPLERWKKIIEEYCNLDGRVAIMNPSNPKASDREDWIHRQASKSMEVILCNPKLVETGLDFCFNYNGQFYSYSSLLFMGASYELAVLWQASHRHYRLNQPEDCRTFWLAYEGTMQMTALQLMAEKIVAVSAIQGKFSSGALTAMARGVDARVRLAESLKNGDIASSDDVKSLFKSTAVDVADEVLETIAPTYWEIIGENAVETITNDIELCDIESLAFIDEDVLETNTTQITADSSEVVVKKQKKHKKVSSDLTEVFSSLFELDLDIFNDERELLLSPKLKLKKKDRPSEGQLSLFDLI